MEKYLSLLNHEDKKTRLEALKKIVKQRGDEDNNVNQSGFGKNTGENKPGFGKIKDENKPDFGKSKDVNNHIHTFYSFSPYSPAAAVYHSMRSGLITTGIMDHDSVSGCREFIEAGAVTGMPVTVGAELRVSFADTPIEGKKINNPDQDTIAYVAFHGIPHGELEAVKEFFKPISENRGLRNRKMTEKINEILSDTGIVLDYVEDVLPLSKWKEGGSVTERHLLFALSHKITKSYGKGEGVVDFLEQKLDIKPSGKNLEFLLDKDNPNYEYDLLNVLKGNMVEKFYIPAKEECPHVSTAAKFAREHGIIFAYAYLGDVTESVTGDKKAQHFEDSYLAILFEELWKQGFNAITYMPSRNTKEQLEKIRCFCDKYDFFQISGEDINQPRQKFVCEAMRSSEFSNLYDSALALIGHEIACKEDYKNGMFSGETLEKLPDLSERVKYFKNLAVSKYDI